MKTQENKKESALWEAFKKGDKDAFGCIYEQYVEALFTYGFYFAKDKALVEDAIHELFVELWRMRANLSDTTSIKYYLFRALQRKICHLMDQETVFSKFVDTANLGSDAEASIEESLIAQEQSEEYKQILSKGLVLLPQRQLQAVHLRFFDNLDTGEIAEIMGMNEQSVRNIISRALHKLRTSFSLFLFFWLFW
ncbi:MAG TPA: sigma-70 family RNA polymerase sigma factor [Haliscomenobacter sp.]|uniref:RNA polymerase sigma factor n=1 Tax=Haliscomenobacter sp. TaxID=2717303 RepID=UPI002B5D55E5|nr:sigma-70 family RNA polymerase sigma factor [Haliscomenobacter sp.]HOY21482.1 sigma-70 family RNA polymerase sigma factor [Haliscomenobacter sp.]